MTRLQRHLCYLIPMYLPFLSFREFIQTGDGVYLVMAFHGVWLAILLGGYAEVILEDLLNRR